MDTTVSGIGAVVVAELRAAGYMESTVGQYAKTIKALTEFASGRGYPTSLGAEFASMTTSVRTGRFSPQRRFDYRRLVAVFDSYVQSGPIQPGGAFKRCMATPLAFMFYVRPETSCWTIDTSQPWQSQCSQRRTSLARCRKCLPEAGFSENGQPAIQRRIRRCRHTGLVQHAQRLGLAGRLEDPRQHQRAKHIVPAGRLIELEHVIAAAQGHNSDKSQAAESPYSFTITIDVHKVPTAAPQEIAK